MDKYNFVCSYETYMTLDIFINLKKCNIIIEPPGLGRGKH